MMISPTPPISAMSADCTIAAGPTGGLLAVRTGERKRVLKCTENLEV